MRFQVADCSFFRTDFGASAIRLLRSFSLLCDWPFPQCAQTLRNKNSVHRRSAQRPKKVGKELCLRPDLVPSNQSAQWRWDLYIGSELGSWDVVRCTGLSLVRDQLIDNFILCLSVTAKSVFGFWKHRTPIIWRRRIDGFSIDASHRLWCFICSSGEDVPIAIHESSPTCIDRHALCIWALNAWYIAVSSLTGLMSSECAIIFTRRDNLSGTC